MLQFFHVEDSEGVIEESQLELPVLGSVGCHGGAAVDLDQPRLKLGIEENVKAVKLEGVVLVRGHYLLKGFQRPYDDLLHLEEGSISLFLSELRQKVLL
jgi:hypothetical protein